MKKFFLFVSVLFIAIGQVWAQTQTISGTVLNDADDEPVIGASVQVKGTVKGTITDFNGKFTLEVDKDADTSNTCVVIFDCKQSGDYKFEIKAYKFASGSTMGYYGFVLSY